MAGQKIQVAVSGSKRKHENEEEGDEHHDHLKRQHMNQCLSNLTTFSQSIQNWVENHFLAKQLDQLAVCFH